MVDMETTYMGLKRRSPLVASASPLSRKVENIKKMADALVLFNRFYRPDIDVETLEVEPSIVLSTTWERRLPLRWIAILCGRVQASLAASGGGR